MNELVNAWRNCTFDEVPYLYSEDEYGFSSLLSGKTTAYQSFGEYTRSSSFGQRNDKKLHLGLLPQPYIGNISQATVFILMLNPGLHSGDYYAENDPKFRKLLLKNIRQENLDPEYPFIYLNPAFSWHPGFEYFHTRFRFLAQELEPKVGSYQKALSVLAQNIACLELLPYHSPSFGSVSLLGKLPSTIAMLKFAKEELSGRAKRNEVLLIVTRSVRYWGLSEHENIILYKGSEPRSGYLTSKSRMKILERLNL
jgi:hypothetical protein